MIAPTAKLSVSRQAILLGISRGSVYYRPRPVSADDLNPAYSPKTVFGVVSAALTR